MVDTTKIGRPKKPSPANIKLQRIMAIADLAGEAKSVTQVFILWHLGKLTDVQMHAAERVADIYGRWHRLNGLRPNPKSASLEPTTAGTQDSEPSPDDKAAYAIWLARCEETRDAWDRLETCFDPRRKEEREIIVRLCVQNQTITERELHDTAYRVLNRVSTEFDMGAPAETSPLAQTRSKPRATRQERLEEGLYATLNVGRLSGSHAPAPMTEAETAEVSARNLAQDAAVT